MNDAYPSPPPLPPPLPRTAVKSVPGMAQSLALAALFYAVTIALTVVAEVAKMLAHLPLDSNVETFIALAVAWPVTFAVALRWSRIRFGEAFPLKCFPLRLVPGIVLASFGTGILLSALANLIPMPQAVKDVFEKSMGQGNQAALFLSVVVIAPLAEEMFFRGLVLRGYLGRYSVRMALWASAAYFAGFHLNPWQFVVALPLGLLAAWLVHRTGSLLPGMLYHAMTNVTVTFLAMPMAARMGYAPAALKAMSNYPLPVLAVAAAAAGIGGGLLWWALKQPAEIEASFAEVPEPPAVM